MSELTTKELAEPQSPTNVRDLLLGHYHEIGISAGVAALNATAEAARSESSDTVEQVRISVLAVRSSRGLRDTER
jgi:hypothetical protein